MDELLAEVRALNRLLKLVFAERIAERVEQVSDRAAVRAVLAVLGAAEGGELATSALLSRVKDKGVARRTAFEALAALERAGLVERPRHGTISLSEFALPYVPRDQVAETDGGNPSTSAGSE